ncbi:hypothetical protein FA15DRAFT_666515 [Coprinopsis marcescibilis]|uniref:Uncharacterized protein n=1 Tax=Coprinopsis marcescibilis TaxID=230819 RepID=A0A5C3L3T9_COPMA|nr:hypothetical protein FA15DRAFT_666515 [Coprinopsis marcescibilis]
MACPPLAVNSIPPEILGEIFFRCSPSSDCIRPFKLRSNRQLDNRMKEGTAQNPLILGHVCKDWRSISRSLPLLWVTVNLHNINKSSLALLALWLEFSSSHPLNVSATITSEEVTHSALAQLFKHAARWRRLHLHIGPGVDDSVLEVVSNYHFLLLEEAMVTTAKEDPLAKEELSEHIISTSPKLTRLALPLTIDISALQTTATRQTLTMIRLETILADDLFPLLEACQHLKEFCTGFLFVRSGFLPTIRTLQLTLPDLRHFEIDLILSQDKDAPRFIDHLTLPSLTELAFPLWFGWLEHTSSLPMRWASWESLLERSGTELKVFRYIGTTLLYSDGHGDTLNKIIRSPVMRHLVHLEFLAHDRVLSTLHHTAQQHFLPDLESITITGKLIGKLSDDLIASMAVSRARASGSKLLRVDVHVEEADRNPRRQTDPGEPECSIVKFKPPADVQERLVRVDCGCIE